MRKVTPKTREEMDCCMPVGSSKDKKQIKVYPHFRMEHEYFEEAKKIEVGKTYDIKLKVKATGLSISKFQNDSEFDIIEVDFGKGSKAEEEKEDE